MSLLPISKPVAEDALASFVGSPISPALRMAYLDWRRVHTVSSLFWKIAADLPCGDEEDATSSFGSAADQLEGVLRDRVTGFTAVTDADRMLKMRCLLESDEDALQGFDHGLLPDLIALGHLVVVVEPAAVERPGTDAEWRNTLTAKPDLIVEQKPADLLRLFTLGEGGELFALAAAYRAAKSDASDRMEAVLASLDAYGAFACAFGYDDKGDYRFTPGAILTEEERAVLAELGHLPDSAVQRLRTAVEAHRAEVSERYRRQEEERKAKKAAEDRAKHGPPLRERLVPLLPSFSDEARDSAVRIIYGASMIALARVMLPEKAQSLSEAELEALCRLDFSTLAERFEPGCEQALHEEIDRLLGMRRSAPAAGPPEMGGPGHGRNARPLVADGDRRVRLRHRRRSGRGRRRRTPRGRSGPGDRTGLPGPGTLQGSRPDAGLRMAAEGCPADRPALSAEPLRQIEDADQADGGTLALGEVPAADGDGDRRGPVRRGRRPAPRRRRPPPPPGRGTALLDHPHRGGEGAGQGVRGGQRRPYADDHPANVSRQADRRGPGRGAGSQRLHPVGHRDRLSHQQHLQAPAAPAHAVGGDHPQADRQARRAAGGARPVGPGERLSGSARPAPRPGDRGGGDAGGAVPRPAGRGPADQGPVRHRLHRAVRAGQQDEEAGRAIGAGCPDRLAGEGLRQGPRRCETPLPGGGVMQTGEEARCFLHAMIGALDTVPAYPKAPAHHAATLASYEALWARGIKVPVRTLCDLARLDEAQVAAGRRLAENPDSREPGRKHSRAFWHGWRSRRMELSPDDRDEAHCELYFRFWWWVLRHRPNCLRIVAGYAPDSDIAQPDQYADLERALERGEPVGWERSLPSPADGSATRSG